MIALAEIKQLPLHEKLIVMEALWEDLSQHEAALPIPDWHQKLLDSRQAQVDDGSAIFIDWDVAKVQIRKAVS